MARRMYGEGSLRQRSDGRWEYRLTEGRGEDGKPIVTSFYGKTQREVKQKLDEYRKSKLSGIYTGSRYTFSQWADIWFENHTEVSPTTKEGYRYTLRILKNQFGKWKLEEIKVLDVENFLKRLCADGKADSSIAQCRGMLFQIFNMAVANDLLMKNPVQYAKKMRSTTPTKEKKRSPPRRSNDSWQSFHRI